MLTAAIAIKKREMPGPGWFRLGFMDGKIVCVKEGTPAPGFIPCVRLRNHQIAKGFTAREWLVLATKLNHVYAEKISCQKQCKS